MANTVTVLASSESITAKVGTTNVYLTKFISAINGYTGSTTNYTVSIPSGSYVTAPSISGYTFLGWYSTPTDVTDVPTFDDASVKASSSSTLMGSTITASGTKFKTCQHRGNTCYVVYAKYQSASLITVSFNANGGSSAPSAITVNKTRSFTLPSDEPVKSGSVFDGWTVNQGGGGTVYSPGQTIAAYTFSSNTVLYAQWIDKVTLTYNPNGGSYTPAPVTNFPETQVTLPTYAGVPPGGQFGLQLYGWLIDGTSYVKGDTYTLQTTTTAVAIWTGVTITATFDKNEPSASIDFTTKDVTYGEQYGTLPTASCRTKRFVQWQENTSTSPVGDAITSSSIVDHSSNFTLYAAWTDYYILHYDGNAPDATNVPDNDYGIGTVTISSQSPSRTGYTFLGWSEDQSATTASYSPGGTIRIGTGKTLYAVWKGITTTCTFDAQEGTVSPSSKSVTYGQQFGELPTPTRDSYSFVGWFDSTSQSANEVTASTTVYAYSPFTIYAKWVQSQFTVTLNPNEGSVSPTSIQVTYGQPYGTLPTPTRTGYNFVGWFTQLEGGDKVTSETTYDKTEDSTLYAHWSQTPVPPGPSGSRSDKIVRSSRSDYIVFSNSDGSLVYAR